MTLHDLSLSSIQCSKLCAQVMLIWFEDMLADPTAALRQLAGFVGVKLSSHLEEDPNPNPDPDPDPNPDPNFYPNPDPTPNQVWS